MRKTILLFIIALLSINCVNAQYRINRIKDVHGGSENHQPAELNSKGFPIKYKNKLYYIGQDSSIGTELFVTEGDSASTKLVVDFNSGIDETFGYYNDNEAIVFNDKMVFTGNVAYFNIQLLQSDGTNAGTKIAKELRTSNSDPSGLMVFNKKLFLSADLDLDSFNYESFLIQLDTGFNIVDSFKFIKVYEPFIFKGNLYYTAKLDSLGNYGLIKIDSSFNVSKIYCTKAIWSAPSFPTIINNRVVFSAYETTIGAEIYYYQNDSVRVLKDINAGSNSSDTRGFKYYDKKLYFSAYDTVKGNELWTTDGTDTGTVRFMDINGGNKSSDPSGFHIYKNSLFFAANNGINGSELWKTDGTATNTILVKDIFSEKNYWDSIEVDIKGFFNYKNKCYFNARADSFGYELHVTDGTAAGTKLVKNINTNDSIWDRGSNPNTFTQFENNLLFFANDYTTGFEWYSLFDSTKFTLNIGKDTTNCESFTITLDSTFKKYKWSNGDSSYFLNITTTGLYWVEVTNEFNEIARDSVDVTINKNPTFSFVDSIFNCGHYNLFAPVAGNYYWNNKSTDSFINIDSSGYYSLSIEDKNCYFKDTTFVTIYELPIFSLGNDTAACDEIVLNGPKNNLEYNWSNKDTLSFILIKNTGSIHLEIKDSNQCYYVDTINITINPLPIFSLGNDTAVCDEIILNGPKNNLEYNWGKNDTLSFILVRETGSIHLEIKDSNQCYYADTINITINPLPIFTLGNDTAACDEIVLNGPKNNLEYNWGKNDTLSFILVRETRSIHLEIKDSNQCYYADTINITINPLPIFTLGNDTAVCDEIILSGPKNNLEYNWSNKDALSFILVKNTGPIHLEIKDSNQCYYADTINITINPLPIFSLGNDTAVCNNIILSAPMLGTPLWNNNLGANTLNITKSGLNYLTIKDNNNCVFTDSIHVQIYNLPSFTLGNDTAVCQNYILANNSFGTKLWSNNASNNQINIVQTDLVWLQITDNNQCKYTDSVFIIINPNPIFSLPNDTILCTIKNYEIIAPIGFQYLWNQGNNTSSIIINQAGNYSVKITDGNTCFNSDTIIIEQGEIPQINLNSNLNSCDSLLVLKDLINKTFIDGSEIFENKKYVSSTTIKYLLVSKDACEAEKKINININSKPKGDSIMFYKTANNYIFYVQNINNYDSVEWTIDNLKVSGNDSLKYRFNQKNAYNIKAVFFNECGEVEFIKTLNLDAVSIENIVNNPFKIFPNPTKGIVYIDNKIDILKLELYDLHGKKQEVQKFKNHIDLNDLSAGVYLLKYNHWTFKLIKE